MRRSASSLFALLLLAPAALAAVAPELYEEPALGPGGVDPWVDIDGDTMTGDLGMGGRGILFQGGALSSTTANDLRFAGQKVCTQGAVGCTGTTYAAGSGLTLSGNTFSVDTATIQKRVSGACAAGSSIRAVDATGGVTCETDDNMAISAGTGLALSGATMSIANGGVGSTQIADGSVQMADVAPMVLPARGNVTLAGAIGATTPTLISRFNVTAPGPGKIIIELHADIWWGDCDSTTASSRECSGRIAVCPAPNSYAGCSMQRDIYYVDPDSATSANEVQEYELYYNITAPSAGSYSVYVNAHTFDATETLVLYGGSQAIAYYVPQTLAMNTW